MRETLDALASRTQPPAAGVASALAAAAAAALVELTAGLAADRVQADGGAGGQGEARLRTLVDRSAELRRRLLATADDDARAYAEVIGAREAAARARALSRASEPPLVIAEAAAEIAEAAAEAARAGSWAFTADAVVAGSLAAAAARGGAELVAADLAGQPGDPRIARARAAAERAERANGAATRPAAN
ncbi:MAG TPA: cyclodeaminase/cyclohydrolase family protein [Solirubrobacterales bacterium]|nr:cyclodeaminase/cyclohydrolase family protein [Solirubrobacterales bacterium]